MDVGKRYKWSSWKIIVPIDHSIITLMKSCTIMHMLKFSWNINLHFYLDFQRGFFSVFEQWRNYQDVHTQGMISFLFWRIGVR